MGLQGLHNAAMELEVRDPCWLAGAAGSTTAPNKPFCCSTRFSASVARLSPHELYRTVPCTGLLPVYQAGLGVPGPCRSCAGVWYSWAGVTRVS
jgi:hypothetical protein